MSSIPPVSSSNIYSASSAQQTGPVGRSTANATSSISSLALPAQREIKGAELFVKSAIAGTIGFLPFVGSKIGEGIVKVSASAAYKAKNFIERYLPLGNFLEYPVRAVIGIPGTIGGVFLFGGAALFSKTQALVWGQDLVEHPQEERINTKLARYGASDKPRDDFWHLLLAFFFPFQFDFCEGNGIGINEMLEKLRKFSAN